MRMGIVVRIQKDNRLELIVEKACISEIVWKHVCWLGVLHTSVFGISRFRTQVLERGV